MARLGLYWHTIRHLRLEQIAYQLYYRFGRGLVTRRAMADVGEIKPRRWSRRWYAPLVGEATQIKPGVFCFLGERAAVDKAADWNAPGRSKLWLYNLHYLTDLNARDADCHIEQNWSLIERWIQDNPPLEGNGWEPYPLSLRLVNLVKWYGRHSKLTHSHLSSLTRQAQALSAQVEKHIQANHLFANAKALTFVGAFLSGAAADKWLRQGLAILDRELPEQFLADGGHFERSSMYHGILLWDLCDLIRLAECSGLPELERRAVVWREVLGRGLAWFDAMCHPDGEIAFFNDAAFGISPPPLDIHSYAQTVGCVPKQAAIEGEGYIHMFESGYIAINLGEGHKAILDVARVGPDHQPGHAHADTLSFELSLYGRRVLVNSGTSVYGTGAERQRQRSTAAHNTVEIDGHDSSEVWAGFRVARRARPVGLKIERDKAGLAVQCAHDGYRWLPGAPRHTRFWRFGHGRLDVLDRVEGIFRHTVARFFLHPEVRVGKGDCFVLPDGQLLRWSVRGGRARIAPSTWHPRFGMSVPNICLEVIFEGSEIMTSWVWD